MDNSNHFVYIISNKSHTVFYTGRTKNLAKRLFEHRTKQVDGFSKRYNLNKLLYYEVGGDFMASLDREHIIKRYPRAWKINLIDSLNPTWRDLSAEFFDE